MKTEKLSITILLLILINLGFKANAQNTPEIKISGNFVNYPLISLLDSLEKDFDIRISYNKEWFKNVKVNGLYYKTKLKKVLSNSLFHTPISILIYNSNEIVFSYNNDALDLVDNGSENKPIDLPHVNVSISVFNKRKLKRFKNEIFINLISNPKLPNIQMNRDFFESLGENYYPLYGIGYKRNINRGFLRATFNFKTLNQKEQPGDWKFKKKNKEYIFRFGYEKQFGRGRLMPFFATDILFNYTQLEGYEKMNIENEQFRIYDVSIKGVGFSHTIGLKFLINKRVMASAESVFHNLYAKEKNYFKDQWSLGNFAENKTSRTGFYNTFNPITLSISYIF